MTQRNIDLTCRHCLRSYDEDGRDYGNYGTGLCFHCFEADQEPLSSSVCRFATEEEREV